MDTRGQRTVFLCAAALALTAAQSDTKTDIKALVGKWKMTSISPDGDSIPWTLQVKEDDGKLAASVISQDGTEQPIKDLNTDEGKVKFKAPYEGELYDIELKMDGDKLTGTWSGNGDSGKTSGQREVS